MDLHGGVSYGRPHVGYEALMRNALLTEAGRARLDHELISGDLNTPFGRSSHHQVCRRRWWRRRSFASCSASRSSVRLGPHVRPQLPADWMSAHVRHVAAAGAFYDLDVERTLERLRDQRQCRCSASASASASATASVGREAAPVSAISLVLAPACSSTRR